MQTKYVQEIQFQIKMLNNLKRWIKKLMVLSSTSFVLVLFGPSIHPWLRPISLTLMIASIIGCIIIGWGYRNGQYNVSKMMHILERK